MCPDILQTTSLTIYSFNIALRMSSIHQTYSDKEVHLIHPQYSMLNDLIFLKPFSNELI